MLILYGPTYPELLDDIDQDSILIFFFDDDHYIYGTREYPIPTRLLDNSIEAYYEASGINRYNVDYNWSNKIVYYHKTCTPLYDSWIVLDSRKKFPRLDIYNKYEFMKPLVIKWDNKPLLASIDKYALYKGYKKFGYYTIKQYLAKDAKGSSIQTITNISNIDFNQEYPNLTHIRIDSEHDRIIIDLSLLKAPRLQSISIKNSSIHYIIIPSCPNISIWYCGYLKVLRILDYTPSVRLDMNYNRKTTIEYGYCYDGSTARKLPWNRLA